MGTSSGFADCAGAGRAVILARPLLLLCEVSEGCLRYEARAPAESANQQKTYGPAVALPSSAEPFLERTPPGLSRRSLPAKAEGQRHGGRRGPAWKWLCRDVEPATLCTGFTAGCR